MKKPIILDVDTGIDDGVAIMLGALCKELDIKLICTCFGNTTAENSAVNTANLLSHIGENDKKIVVGSTSGIFKTRQSVNVHGKNGLGDFPFPKQNFEFETDFVDAYKTAILSSKEKVTILVLGPLTNLARVLEGHPEIKNNIEQVVFMGSSLKKYGDDEIPYAGFNVACDPEATEIVLKSGLEIVFCPNDLGKKCRLSPQEVEVIKNTNKTGEMLYTIFGAYKDRQIFDGVAMYDSTTVYYLINSQDYEIRPVNIEVRYYDELETGVALADFDKKPNAKMLVDLNVDNFKKYCFEKLKGIK